MALKRAFRINKYFFQYNIGSLRSNNQWTISSMTSLGPIFLVCSSLTFLKIMLFLSWASSDKWPVHPPMKRNKARPWHITKWSVGGNEIEGYFDLISWLNERRSSSKPSIFWGFVLAIILRIKFAWLISSSS